jgi:hypothetical protein
LQERGELPRLKVQVARQVLKPLGTALSLGQRAHEVGPALTLVRRKRLR